MNGWDSGEGSMSNSVRDLEMDILQHLQCWQPPFVWNSLENSAGTKVIDVARTLGKSVVSLNKQRETTENPEPSTSSDSRVLPKLQDVSDSDIINNKDILMRKFSSVEKLANDQDDNLSSAPEETQNERPRRMLVGWDSFRTKTMILLLILFLLWAAIYFPLIST